AVVFVGFGVGGGDVAVSLVDFGRHTAKHAKAHVLSPNENNYLCKTFGHGFKNRPTGFKIYGQQFRWKSFAESLLGFLSSRAETHARCALGHESEIVLHHDWFENPEYVVSGQRIS